MTSADRPSIEKDGEKLAATKLLKQLGLKEGQYVIGNTKTFLKARAAPVEA